MSQKELLYLGTKKMGFLNRAALHQTLCRETGFHLIQVTSGLTLLIAMVTYTASLLQSSFMRLLVPTASDGIRECRQQGGKGELSPKPQTAVGSKEHFIRSIISIFNTFLKPG